MILTRQEDRVLKLNAVGFSAKEIADKLSISTVTAQNHLKHIKEKLNLQKSTELVAFYWCGFFGSTFEEQRRAIAGMLLIALIIFETFSIDNNMTRSRRARRTKGKNEIEFYEEIYG